MADLRLLLLGPPRVLVGGEPLQVDTRKAVAVLALLALDGAWTRESLAGLLWPDSDPTRARAALRRTLSVLHRGLGHGGLQVGRTQIDLEGLVDIDVTHVDELLRAVEGHAHGDAGCGDCRSRLVEAVDLHRGELLEGFVLRDSPGFDDWRAVRAEHRRRRLCRALDLLGQLDLADRDLPAAVASCQRWRQVDPLNEEVHRRLMLLHAWQGDRGEAVATYRSCVQVLDRDLGVAPVDRTTALYRAILEDRLPSPPGHRDVDVAFPSAHAVGAPPRPSTTAERASPDDDLPLVGRDASLARLLDEHARPGGRVLAVVGEAGVGKTRLADEFVGRVRGAGGRVAAARCHSDEVAFGPVVDLLQQAVGQLPVSRLGDLDSWCLAEVARLVPDLVGTDPDPPSLVPPSASGAQARLFEAVWTVLESALSIGHRGALVVDDLQAIDAASLDLLAYGLRRLADRQLTVLVCLRPEDLGDDHAVRALLDSLPAAQGPRVEVVLERLADPDVDALVHAVLDGADEVVEQIRTESEGLPLLVVEYLRLLQDSPDDTATTDLRRLVPHGAAELARRRLAHVSQTARQIASTAATIGRSFDLSVVLAASGRTEEEVVVGLDELLARWIVRELPAEEQVSAADVRYDFVHDKLRQAIYERTSLARRRLLHGRVAEALAAGTRGGRGAGAAAARIAEHHRRAGHDREAAAWFRLAGDHARSLFANHEALEHYRRSLALDDPGDSEVHVRVAEARMLLGDYREALQALELAAARAVDDAGLAAIEHQLGLLHLRRGSADAATAHLDRAAGLTGTAPRLARIHADRALAAVRAGDLDTAVAAAATAHAHGEEAGDVEALAQVRNVQGIVARHRGNPALARENFGASADLAADLGDPTAAIAAMNNLALTEADAGDLEGAIARAREAVILVTRRGDRHREAALRNNLADLLHRAGREDEALATLKEAVTIFAEVGRDPDELHPEIWKLVEW